MIKKKAVKGKGKTGKAKPVGGYQLGDHIEPSEAAPDPHAEGYRVDLETDPLRAAAYLLSCALSAEMLRDARRASLLKAKRGDMGQMYGTERETLRWLDAQWQRDPGTTICLWTAHFMTEVKSAGGI